MPPTTTDLPALNELLATAVGAVGGSERPGQVAMAEAVQRSIRTGDHLAVQAGTGTGKSLAYLVPALRHAVATEGTVVVSTATIALQRQLVDRDLPRLEKALAGPLGRKPTFAILKGRRNYLCLHKIDSGMEDEPDDAVLFDPFAVSRMGREVTRLREWSSETETGDRDEVVPGVTEQAWRQVSVSARECLGAARCPIGTDCFAEKARAEAGRADLIVTNHALLAIDAMQGYQVLPEHDLVIVDEAHDLVDRVTSVATGELTAALVVAAARRAGRVVDQEVADRLLEAGDGLALIMEDLPIGRLDVAADPARRHPERVARRRARVHLRARLGEVRRPRGGDRAQARAVAARGGARHGRAAARRLGPGRRPPPRRGVAHRGQRPRPAPPADHQGGAARGGRAAAGAAVRADHDGTDVRDADAGRQLRLDGPVVGAAGRAGSFDADGGRGHREVHRGSEVDRAGRRVAVRPRPQRHPVPGQTPAAAGPRRAATVLSGRDQGPDDGGRRPHARAVLVDAGGEAGHRGAAEAQRPADPVSGRGLDGAAGAQVRRGRVELPVRHAVAVAGRRRAGARRCSW